MSCPPPVWRCYHHIVCLVRSTDKPSAELLRPTIGCTTLSWMRRIGMNLGQLCYIGASRRCRRYWLREESRHSIHWSRLSRKDQQRGDLTCSQRIASLGPVISICHHGQRNILRCMVSDIRSRSSVCVYDQHSRVLLAIGQASSVLTDPLLVLPCCPIRSLRRRRYRRDSPSLHSKQSQVAEVYSYHTQSQN